jgi:glycine cleavage system aminomethyltransferase T
VGDALVLDGAPVGRVVAVAWSGVLGRPLCLAVLPVDLAYAGLPFRLGAADGPVVETLSMPPIMPRSLTVKLDEL